MKHIIFFSAKTYIFSLDGTWSDYKCWNPDDGIPFNESTPFMHGIRNESESETAVEQFWK
jgi:hypothetical protein